MIDAEFHEDNTTDTQLLRVSLLILNYWASRECFSTIRWHHNHGGGNHRHRMSRAELGRHRDCVWLWLAIGRPTQVVTALWCYCRESSHRGGIFGAGRTIYDCLVMLSSFPLGFQQHQSSSNGWNNNRSTINYSQQDSWGIKISKLCRLSFQITTSLQMQPWYKLLRIDMNLRMRPVLPALLSIYESRCPPLLQASPPRSEDREGWPPTWFSARPITG